MYLGKLSILCTIFDPARDVLTKQQWTPHLQSKKRNTVQTIQQTSRMQLHKKLELWQTFLPVRNMVAHRVFCSKNETVHFGQHCRPWQKNLGRNGGNERFSSSEFSCHHRWHEILHQHSQAWQKYADKSSQNGGLLFVSHTHRSGAAPFCGIRTTVWSVYVQMKFLPHWIEMQGCWAVPSRSTSWTRVLQTHTTKWPPSWFPELLGASAVLVRPALIVSLCTSVAFVVSGVGRVKQ